MTSFLVYTNEIVVSGIGIGYSQAGYSNCYATFWTDERDRWTDGCGCECRTEKPPTCSYPCSHATPASSQSVQDQLYHRKHECKRMTGCGGDETGEGVMGRLGDERMRGWEGRY